jgi:hypothetical protein
MPKGGGAPLTLLEPGAPTLLVTSAIDDRIHPPEGLPDVLWRLTRREGFLLIAPLPILSA